MNERMLHRIVYEMDAEELNDLAKCLQGILKEKKIDAEINIWSNLLCGVMFAGKIKVRGISAANLVFIMDEAELDLDFFEIFAGMDLKYLEHFRDKLDAWLQDNDSFMDNKCILAYSISNLRGNDICD